MNAHTPDCASRALEVCDCRGTGEPVPIETTIEALMLATGQTAAQVRHSLRRGRTPAAILAAGLLAGCTTITTPPYDAPEPVVVTETALAPVVDAECDEGSYAIGGGCLFAEVPAGVLVGSVPIGEDPPQGWSCIAADDKGPIEITAYAVCLEGR